MKPQKVNGKELSSSQATSTRAKKGHFIRNKYPLQEMTGDLDGALEHEVAWRHMCEDEANDGRLDAICETPLARTLH